MGYRTDSLTGGTTATGGIRMLRRLAVASLLLVLVLGSGGTRAAEAAEVLSASGSFMPAGPLGVARAAHTATTLPDGRVLVVGGFGEEYVTTSAEVWDSATGSFGPTGPLAEARAEHTGTLLTDGRVLVVGGRNAQNDVIASTEVWDPATGSFEPAGSLAVARNEHTATLLTDGRVLVVGGVPEVGTSPPAEVWDPATGSFDDAGSLSAGRYGHTATLLPDGRVLVVGGYDDEPPCLIVFGVVLYCGRHEPLPTSAEVWDPATGSFDDAGSLADGRYGHTATLLPGFVLVVGGADEDDVIIASAEVWYPTEEQFGGDVGPPSEPRRGHTAALLPDGRVLVVGGSGEEHLIASADVWDPQTGAFEPVGSLAEARIGHTSTPLPDGRVLIVGGWDPTHESALASAEMWSPLHVPVMHGGRVEAPEAGIAVTFPDDWVVEVRPIVRAEFISDAVLSAEAPGGASCEVMVQEGIPWSSIDDWAESVLQTFGSYGPEVEVTSTALRLPVGDGIRIDMEVPEEGFSGATYMLTDGATFYGLMCDASNPPEDRWLSIAETFEFLPVEESPGPTGE